MTTTLEAITTNFRRFTKNQVLTEGHLNQIVDYFDDQIRLSRTCLSGVGIVCGFEVNCDDITKEITITQGVGVTTDGDLFSLFLPADDGDFRIDFESLAYKGYKTYDNSNVQYEPFFYKNNKQITLRELTLEDSGNGVKPLNGLATLKDMVVLLYLETFVEDTDLCTTLGCDNQGENRVANHKVLLVNKTDAQHIIDQDPSIQKTNYSKLYYDLPEVIMNKVVAVPDIFDSYTDLKRSFADAILDKEVIKNLGDGFKIMLGMDYIDAPDLLSEIETKIDQVFDFEAPNAPADVQYRYDLLKDLVDTYNEIKQILLHIDVSDCCAGYQDFPKHLMIGEVQKEGQCYAYRHGFYKSPILANNTSTGCESCDPVTLDYDFEGSTDDVPACEGSIDPNGDHGHHIVFVIDESGSFRRQKEFVTQALNGYLDSVMNTNTYVSLIGMTYNDNTVRQDHLIYRPVADPSLRDWISMFADPSSPSYRIGGDFWGTGYTVVIDAILNTRVPDPAIVITLADEYPGGTHIISAERATYIKKRTKLFNYIVDYDNNNILAPNAANSLPPGNIASIDGESDLDTADYFFTANFNDLEIKIKNLNESLINSNIFCQETTADEVDPSKGELTICYSADKSEQRLFSLIKRVALQLTNYNPEYRFVKITPSLELGVLSKKAIPFYYNVGEKLIEYWDFDKTVMGRHKTNLSYHDSLLAIKKPLQFCIDNDFYRVEGHLGRNYLEVIDRINTVKKSNSLGFNVVALPLNSRDVVGIDYKEYYLSKNYGLEHKAGVPEGGTLILFYLETTQIEEDRISEDFIEEQTRRSDKVRRVKTVEEGQKNEKRLPVASQFNTLFVNETNPVVADFCLPYLCCDENEPDACLPDEIVCFDEETERIPFEVTPRNAVVTADVALGLNGGVVIDRAGNYFFDPKIVSEILHGTQIRFKVNNQRSKFSVKIFRKPELEITNTLTYESNRTVARVIFTITGSELNQISLYRWDFGDGSPISDQQPNSTGQVVHSYRLPVNSANIVNPKLTVVKGLCETEVPIDEIDFGEVPYYYYYGSDNVKGFDLDSDSILSISIGDL